MAKREFEYKPYGEKTIHELDEEIDYLMEQELKWDFYKLLIVLALLLLINKNSIWFNLSHAFPIPSGYTSEKIFTKQPPSQLDIINNATNFIKLKDKEKTGAQGLFSSISSEELDYIRSESPLMLYRNTSGIKNVKKVKILPIALYSISGRAQNITYFFDKGSNRYDSVALFDIKLGWGGISDKKGLKEKKQLESENELHSQAKEFNLKTSKNIEEIDKYREKFSNTQVIPANDNVLSALMKLKKYDLIKMEGYLVDVFIKNSHLKTSVSRNDTDKDSRGNGACEIMYVTKVQLGHFIYE